MFSTLLQNTNTLYLAYLSLRNEKKDVTKENLPPWCNLELLTPNTKFTEVNVRRVPSSLKNSLWYYSVVLVLSLQP